MTDAAEFSADIVPGTLVDALPAGPARDEDRLYLIAFAVALGLHLLPFAYQAGVYQSFTAGKSSGEREVPDAAQKSPPPKEKAARKEEPQEPEPNPVTPSQLTLAEAEQLIRSAQMDLQDIAESTSRASLAAQGDASPSLRAVLRKLKQTMPKPRNLTGILVVRILLEPSGAIQSVDIIQSSGKKELDQLVLDRVRSTQLLEPGQQLLTNKERLLKITYEYF